MVIILIAYGRLLFSVHLMRRAAGGVWKSGDSELPTAGWGQAAERAFNESAISEGPLYCNEPVEI